MPYLLAAFTVLILACGTFACLTAKASDAVPSDSGCIHTLYAVRDAIRAVECPRSEAEEDRAYEREKALGPYQIRPCMVAECNRILGAEKFRHDHDAHLEGPSRQMFSIYSVYWCRRTGDWSAEGIARRWNSGPDGAKKKCSLGYCRKVKAELAKQPLAQEGGGK